MRPVFVRVIRPHCSRTRRCLEMAGAEMSNGSLSVPMGHGPCANCLSIARRVGSARAPNTASRESIVSFTRRLGSHADYVRRVKDVAFQTGSGAQKLRGFLLWNRQILQRRDDMFDETVPFTLRDAKTVMRCLHVAAQINNRSAEC